MENLMVIVEKIESKMLYGVSGKSNDKTISDDIKVLSEKYRAIMLSPGRETLPYFVLSRDYDEKFKGLELFIGSIFPKHGLQSLELPAGEYAKITVKPKLGFLWGISIGEAKRFFYKKWLPESRYQALNVEYEYHTERSIGKHPTIDIIFAVERDCKNRDAGLMPFNLSTLI